jgi:hypothetical protein
MESNILVTQIYPNNRKRMKTLFIILRRVLILAIVVILLIQITGCSSTRGLINFSSLNYPASMSAFLCDQNQKVVMKGRELETLYSFEHKKTFWSLVYGLIPLSQGESINKYLNSIVDQYKGDGIINLTITIEHGAVNKIYSFLMYLPSLIPIFPSSALITVSGEVVKLKQTESSYLFDENLYDNFISRENISLKINEKLFKNTK